MQKYLTPSIQSHNLLNEHLIGIQQSCSQALNGETLTIESQNNICGIYSGTVAQFCLSGTTDFSSQLNGLILEGTGGTQGTLDGCTLLGQGACQVGSLEYACFNVSTTGSECVLNLSCSDGTVITTCPSSSCIPL